MTGGKSRVLLTEVRLKRFNLRCAVQCENQSKLPQSLVVVDSRGGGGGGGGIIL